MIGQMIAKIRKDRDMAKVELAKKTNINVGHLTHIEKEERNPSHKALKSICEALEVPYQNLLHMYDKEVTKEHLRYNLYDHVSYNRVLAVDKIEDFIECPANIQNASLAFRIQDDSMEPKFRMYDFAFLELNVPLSNREFGLFLYNGQYLVRRFIIRQDKLILRPENREYPEIDLSEEDDFTIIGRVIAE